MSSHIPLIVILGPTATGKSDLAVSVARWIATSPLAGYTAAEIVSADSRQVYTGLDIGTGKITTADMHGIPHHLLDVADPMHRFTAADYRALARKAVLDIHARGKLPIICGGTGFYIDALLQDEGYSSVGPDEALREKLSSQTPEQLLAMLQKLDPARAETIAGNPSDRANPRRIIRAIEIASAPAQRTENSAQQDSISFAPIFIGLNVEADTLDTRIRSRLTTRLDHGMLDEARRLRENGLTPERMDELGLEYRYMSWYLDGTMTLPVMTEKLAIAIRQYAKRQMTWFKRDSRIAWFDANDIALFNKICEHIVRSIEHQTTP